MQTGALGWLKSTSPLPLKLSPFNQTTGIFSPYDGEKMYTFLSFSFTVAEQPLLNSKYWICCQKQQSPTSFTSSTIFNHLTSLCHSSHTYFESSKDFTNFGIPLIQDKTSGPCTSIEFLGINLDSWNFQASLPKVKSNRTILVFSFIDNPCCSKREPCPFLDI